jgi:hypothetical protein
MLGMVSILRVTLAAVSSVSGLSAQVQDEAFKDAPPGISYSIAPATKRWKPAKLVKTGAQTVQLLRSVKGMNSKKINPRSVAAVLGSHQRLVGGTGYLNVPSTSAYGTQYAIEVQFNGHSLELILDTGSSDTWAVQTSFSCVDYSGQYLPQSICGFGETYPGWFQYGLTDPETHMFIQYGDSEVVTGPMGYSDVTIGSITVKKQEVCLANTTYWYGNNQTSGLIGLAFPSLTNAYLGEAGDHNWENQVKYSPVFTNMVDQGLVDPVFSIAIDRNSSAGMIAFGGIAPASGLDWTKTAVLDMVIVSFSISAWVHIQAKAHRVSDFSDCSPCYGLSVLFLHHHPGWLVLRPDHQHQEVSLHC